MRALEDLVISAIYAGLLHAKLDTAKQLVEVSSTAGRDVAPAEMADMVAILRAWNRQCDDVLQDIDEQMRTVQREAAQKKADRAEYEKLVAARRDDAKAAQDPKGATKGKRVISDGAEDRGGYVDDDDMDLDDAAYDGSSGAAGGAGGSGASWASNAGRRRIKGRLGGMLGNKRR